MNPTEAQLNIRQQLIETLELISSQEKQIKYQQHVPIANVSAEIFCLWSDDLYANGSWLKESWSQELFSERQREEIAKFDKILNEIADSLPTLPPIDQFILTPEWHRLSEAAQTALCEFQPTNKSWP